MHTSKFFFIHMMNFLKQIVHGEVTWVRAIHIFVYKFIAIMKGRLQWMFPNHFLMYKSPYWSTQAMLTSMRCFNLCILDLSSKLVSISSQPRQAYCVVDVWNEMTILIGFVCCFMNKICCEKKRDDYVAKIYIVVQRRVHDPLFDVFALLQFIFRSLW